MNASVIRLDKLDHLIRAIDRCSPPDEAGLAHEHIQEARTYLLGGMPYEYELSLEMARETFKHMNRSDSLCQARQLLEDLAMN